MKQRPAAARLSANGARLTGDDVQHVVPGTPRYAIWSHTPGSPHVIVGAADPRRHLVAQVVRDGVTTHGHPRALVGAAVYAAALHPPHHKGTLEYGELLASIEADDSWQMPEIAFSALPDGWVDAATQLQPK